MKVWKRKLALLCLSPGQREAKLDKEIALRLVVKHKKISEKISKQLKTHLQTRYSAPGRHKIIVARLLQVWRAGRVVGHLKIQSSIFFIIMSLFNLITVCNLWLVKSTNQHVYDTCLYGFPKLFLVAPSTRNIDFFLCDLLFIYILVITWLVTLTFTIRCTSLSL